MNSPATEVPRSFGRYYEGHDLTLANMDRVWSVGKTPRQAVLALARARRWRNVHGFTKLVGGDESYTWGFSFWADGTSVKVAGIHVPGGVICTWWK